MARMTTTQRRTRALDSATYTTRRGLACLLASAVIALLAFSVAPASAARPDTPNLLDRVTALEAQVNQQAAQINSLLAALNAEAADREAGDAATLAEANAHADGQDAATLAAANSYADGQDAATLAAANAYADDGDGSTLAGANTYTDDQIATALGGLDPAELAALSTDLDAVQDTLAPFTTVPLDPGDPDAGYDVYLESANLHLRNGLGATNGYPTDPATVDPNYTSTNGLGNLIIGYNEVGGPGPGGMPIYRGGSHNIIVGYSHGYTGFGGLAVGWTNYIHGPYASVTAGSMNAAWAPYASVTAGYGNTANGDYSSVSGGQFNLATGDYSSVRAGYGNAATIRWASVSGGREN
ncbi:MAG: hypothetical protein JSV79_05145, partial [Armatimonadota bacterium]